MALSSVQPQAASLRQRTPARLWRSSKPKKLPQAAPRAGHIAPTRNEAACPHPTRCLRAMPEPSPKPTENRNPHSLRLWPAGSFLGDFRTPAGARNSSRQRKVRFWPEPTDLGTATMGGFHPVHLSARIWESCRPSAGALRQQRTAIPISDHDWKTPFNRYGNGASASQEAAVLRRVRCQGRGACNAN